MLANLLLYWPIVTVVGAALLGGVRWGVRIHTRVADLAEHGATKTTVAELNTKLTDVKEQTNRIESKVDRMLLLGR